MLDLVRKGEALNDIAGRHTMEDIVAAVRDAKTALRLGLTPLDDAALRRAAREGWTIPMLVGHALVADGQAHRIARSLALGRVPDAGAISYDTAGDPDATKEQLLAGIRSSEERLVQAQVLAAGGPTFAHRDLGPLTARGWILFIGVHDAMHLHQAAAIVRAR